MITAITSREQPQLFKQCAENHQPRLLRIKCVAKKYFQALMEAVFFPVRFFGRKTGPEISHLIAKIKWLGGKILGLKVPYPVKQKIYQWRSDAIPKEKAREFLRYQSVAASLFRNEASWLEPFGFTVVPLEDLKLSLPGKMEIVSNNFMDNEAGFKCFIVEGGGEVVVGFGSVYSALVDFSDDHAKHKPFLQAQLNSGAKNFLGFVPRSFEIANQLFQALQTNLRFCGKKIVLAGQCLGGAMASYVALQNNVPAFCANTLPLGAGAQVKIGREKLSRARDLITHVTVSGDPMSDNFLHFSFFDRIFTFLGIRTPGNFGRRYQIGTAYKGNWRQTHERFMDSLSLHLGYTSKTRPKEMRQEDILK